MSSSISFKLQYQGYTKAATQCPATFQELSALAKQYFSLTPEICTFSYKDADGDQIMLTNEEDWQNCLADIKSCQLTKLKVDCSSKFQQDLKQNQIYSNASLCKLP